MSDNDVSRGSVVFLASSHLYAIDVSRGGLGAEGRSSPIIRLV